MTTIDRLKQLLEAEGAEMETLSRLAPQGRSPEMEKLLKG